MSNNTQLKIEVSDNTELTGRLVGFIDEDECKAILNSKNAAKKISTSESITVSDNIGHIADSRFVLVVKEPPENGLPAIFISPIIKRVSWKKGNARLHCGDMKTYIFEKEVSG